MVAVKFAPEDDFLRKVAVPLLADNEVGQFNFYLEREHYLESSRLAGQSIRYVAEVGQWVALLTFSAAALHLKARELAIGWTARQRARRLGLVAQNSRFLVLPQRQRYPSLASRVLGLALRRLSQDWRERWGHPVLVVERFVDESRYPGTCYRACGFQAVGATKGFKRASRDFYEEHGQPKQLYLRELRPGACQKLRQARLPQDLALYEAEQAGPCPFRVPALESLLEQLGTLRDSRYGHGLRHPQRFVLRWSRSIQGAGGASALLFDCVAGFVGQDALIGPAAARPVSTASFFALGAQAGAPGVGDFLQLAQKQLASEIAIHSLLPGDLAFDLGSGGPVQQHDTSRGFIDVLPAVAAGADEGFLNVLLL